MTTRTPKLVSVQVAAEHVAVSTKTIRRWIAEGRLPGYRLGPRALRVDLHELDAMADRLPTAESQTNR